MASPLPGLDSPVVDLPVGQMKQVWYSYFQDRNQTGSGGAGSGARTKLTTATTYNIPVDFADVGAAVNYLSTSIDGGGNIITLQLADGTYSKPLFYVPPLVGIPRLIVQGNASNVQAVTLSSSSGSIMQMQDPGGPTVIFKNMRFDVTGCFPAIGCFQSNSVIFDNCYWKGSGTNNLAIDTSSCAITSLVNGQSVESIGSSGTIFCIGSDNGFVSFEPSCTLTIVGTPAFAAFVFGEHNGVVSFVSSTIVNGGAATGATYVLHAGAVLDLFSLTGTMPGGILGFGDGSEVIRLSDGTISQQKPLAITATTSTIANTEVTVIYGSLSAHTTTLPAASTNPGKIFNMKNVTPQTVSSASSNIVPRIGGAAGTAILSAIQGSWATLQSDGVNWTIIAGN